MMQNFKMKELGDLRFFLGVEIDRHNNRLTLTQQKYTLDLLKKSGMSDCKPVGTPSVLNQRLSAQDGELYEDPTQYRSIVGALQYLTFTRPDIIYAVNQVSQFMHAPRDTHMDAVKRILRYLKGTVGDGLVYGKSENITTGHQLMTFTDADWAGDPDQRKSISGFCIFIGRNLVSWSCRKQKAVARSSTEAEYRCMAAGTAEVTWVRHLLEDIGENIKTSMLMCDNQSAINIAFNPVQHGRTKHIEIDQHFVRQKVEDKEIQPIYVRTDEQVADLFTKGLTKERFWFLKGKLYMVQNHAQLEGGC
ncbi:uncharacterized mitochondrial protein AtMg00810-like [Nymphaea colorata]|uniref:uncharacterized mitochondrial protein AtMg00810-like n=1 Tax=Nymphaea colorata TaxID=210225 RepID=UPI00214F0CE5|nr:uncharacterized mitochondrial protein AtMg00810-like [Nymphaea colorata]